MREMNEKLAREVTKMFVTTLVDEVGKLIMKKCARKAGSSNEVLNTEGDNFRVSVHLDGKEKEE